MSVRQIRSVFLLSAQICNASEMQPFRFVVATWYVFIRMCNLLRVNWRLRYLASCSGCCIAYSRFRGVLCTRRVVIMCLVILTCR